MKMRDDDARNRLLDTLEGVPAPPRRIDDVLRRMRARRTSVVRWRRRASWFVASALVFTGVVLPDAALLPLGGAGRGIDRSTEARGATEQLLAVGGIRVTLPEGWDGRAYYIHSYTRPVIRLATFPLPESDDIGASGARSSMREGDILLGLTEYSAICPCPGFDQTSFPLALAHEDFETPHDVWHDLPPQEDAVPVSHDFARRTFVENDRFVDLWVEFGQNPPSQDLISDVGAVIASFAIGDFEPPSQPDGLCHEWILPKDPDCPQTIWLKAVLSEAGFEAIDDAQESTLVGQGGGAKFNIWVREPTFPLEDLPLVYTVEGLRVYGGEYLVWRAQGQIVSIANFEDGRDTMPDENGLAALVKATIDMDYPSTG